MKKKVLFVFIFSIISGSLFANFDYKFDAISLNPLHKEYFADRTRPDFSISNIFYFDGFPDKILQDNLVEPNNENDDERSITVWDFNGDIDPNDRIVSVKIGETFGLARNTFTFDSWLSPIAFDFSMQALLQHFYRGSFDDTVSYDGIYFFGGTFRIADKVSMRIGKHHYCSHYGDASIKRILDGDNINTVHDTNNTEPFWLTYKYVRMNGTVFALSVEPNPHVRVYGELNYLSNDLKSFRPDMFAPNWITRDGSSINPDYPDSYKARIVNVGVELSYPIFENLGNTTFGYDLHMYEEGKIDYKIVTGNIPKYNDDLPWELEHNIKVAQDLGNSLSFEVAYHKGRSVMNSYFFQDTSTLTIGLRFNPDSTLNIVDTGKN